MGRLRDADESVEGRAEDEPRGKSVPRPQEGEEKRGVGVGEGVEDGRLPDESEEQEWRSPEVRPSPPSEEKKEGMAEEELLEAGPGQEEALEKPARALFETEDQSVDVPASQDEEPCGQEEEKSASRSRELLRGAKRLPDPRPSRLAQEEDDPGERRDEQGRLHSAELGELHEEGRIGEKCGEEEATRDGTERGEKKHPRTGPPSPANPWKENEEREDGREDGDEEGVDLTEEEPFQREPGEGKDRGDESGQDRPSDGEERREQKQSARS